jgi:branched-subunit amino acid ABC-type transport system permease component
MAGMITGLVISVIFIYMLLSGVKQDPLLHLPTAGGPGVFGVTASFLILIVVLIFRPTGLFGESGE